MQFTESLGLAIALGAGLWSACASPDAGPPAGAEQAPVHSEPGTANLHVEDGLEALSILQAGNRRFVEGELIHSHESPDRRAGLTGGQSPFVIILGCADSRVPPEILFDVGLGDAFVIRVAGNLPGPYETGSIEYAVDHLGTPLLLVLGHENCGAVTAALGALEAGVPLELEELLDSVREGLDGIDPDLPLEERIHLGVEANVRNAITRLKAIADRIDRPEEQRVAVAGAVYELETGRVRMIDLNE